MSKCDDQKISQTILIDVIDQNFSLNLSKENCISNSNL